MRDNFMRHRADYDLEHVIGLFCCTFRIRGWFGKDYICRKNDGDPEVMDAFKCHFMNMSQWCLLEKFWKEYPDLVEGLDSNLMLREEDLSPLPWETSERSISQDSVQESRGISC